MVASILAAVVSYVAFLLIATTQRRPRRLLFGSTSPSSLVRRSVARTGTALLLAVALGLAVGWEGWSFGVIVWATMLSVSAIATGLTLAWAAKPVGRVLRFLE